MKIKKVKYADGYSIEVEFEDGIIGVVNLSDFIGTGIFSVLKDPVQFAKVYTTGYSIAWSDDLEIDAANIYSELTGKDPASYFTQTTYATN
ncbi:MAG: DUF2442 domain-containing protein [Bacteroidetes bacterium]|nr:DUF2442 domain-containing protein [Bacteroidota bacterium]